MGNYSEIDRETLYPNGQLYGNGIANGNFVRPANFRIPDFCEGCPMNEGFEDPQITKVYGLYPVNIKGAVYHKGTTAAAYPVLVLNDENKPSISPKYLGEVPFVSSFSIEHESGDSQLLGYIHDCVSRCTGPETKKKLFRENKVVCSAGLDLVEMGYRLKIKEDDLSSDSSYVVVESQERARENPLAGREIKEVREPEPGEIRRTIEALHQASMKVPRSSH